MVVTLGGWQEVADAAVIDRFERSREDELERLQKEIGELREVIERLQP